ncbi:sigma-70 family RNA polymerase sigma factor [Candidatus Peregrinibacteria bacterium]|jgi:RNA polymerase sigma factor FliA|nr:sigma-70 family RNA polymerase sigma factor [Candidatus Peregrinibacteria bacterium]MBT7484257.1 sigma-70 family RNA polymerase sigma factor [Candidatus Peregrinibacteria bacterium]MBT7703011.1 sigma-70 family RNA polymerase sigma factor [Candidatus Peregrinibacteria bacterium]
MLNTDQNYGAVENDGDLPLSTDVLRIGVEDIGLMPPQEVIEIAIKLRRWFFGKAKSRGLDEYEAEDVFQMVMLQVCERGRLVRDQNPQAWLKSRLIGEIRDEWRRKDGFGKRRTRDLTKEVKHYMTRQGCTLDEALSRVGIDRKKWEELRMKLEQGYLTEYGGNEGDEGQDPESIFDNIPDDARGAEEETMRQRLAEDLIEVVLDLFMEMPFRDAVIYFLYEWNGKNLRAVGEVIGLSGSRVSQLKAQVEKSLRIASRRTSAKNQLEGALELEGLGVSLGEEVRDLLLNRCVTEADRLLLNRLALAVGCAERFDVLTEVFRVGGVQNVSDEFLEIVGYQKVKARRGGRKNGVCWEIKKAIPMEC